MSRKSANILVLGWLLILLGSIGIALTYNIEIKGAGNFSSYRSGNCPLADSYYRESDLTKVEKQQFSSNAKAFDLIGQSKKRYRLLYDYYVDTQTRKRIEVKAYLHTPDSLDDLSISTLLNGAGTSTAKNADNQQNYVIFTDSYEASSNSNSLGISLKKREKCEFSLNNLINVDIKQDYGNPVKNWTNQGSAIANYKTDKISLLPGDNYLSFEDWSYLGSLLKKGLMVYSYDSNGDKWAKLSKDAAVARPAKVYLIKNNSKKTLEIDNPPPYRVPEELDVLSLQKGWNLLAFDFANKKIADVEVAIDQGMPDSLPQSTFSLKKLVEDGYIANLSPLESDKAKPSDIHKILEQEALGKYWIKLSGEPSNISKLPNLVLKVEGVGDTFSGRQIPMKIVIENQDSIVHGIISSNMVDPCQIGVRVKTTQGKIIHDDYKNRKCPLWPKLEDLSVGGKKEYNYLWEAPEGLKGSYAVEVYFNYSRLFGSQLVKESSITLK